jgi:large subunit ribosomal protein L18
MAKYKSSYDRRKARNRYSIRKSLAGKARLTVFRSNQHIYAQLVDDENGVTLASASTMDKDLGKLKSFSNVEAAEKVGELIAKKAKDQKVAQVVFDRGGYLYHGRVKALAEAARKAGLKF